LTDNVVKSPPKDTGWLDDTQPAAGRNKLVQTAKAAAEAAGNGLKEAAQGVVGLRPWEVLGNLLARGLPWVPWSLYVLLMLCLLGLAYYQISSEGWRLTLPTLGMKLHKLSLPGVENFQRFKGWNKMDVANAMALVLELATFWAYDVALKHWLCAETHVHARWNAERFKKLVMVLAVGVIGFDGYLFFRGTQALLWGSSTFSLTAVVTTLGWMILIVIASVISVQLQPLPKKKED